MTKNSKPKPDNPDQFKRFIETARALGAESGDTETFDRLLKKVARSARSKSAPKTGRPRKAKGRG